MATEKQAKVAETKAKAKVKKRDRERTKSRILKAVGKVIEKYGTKKVGVNLIAREADVNKVLIYRYFGGVDGLMEQYVKTGEYTSTSSHKYIDNMEKPAPDKRSKVWTDVLTTAMNDLRERKATRDLVRWEIGLGKAVLTDVRNDTGARMIEKVGSLPNYEDTNALVALLMGGIYHVTVSADYRDKMMDVDLQSDEGFKRIEKVVGDIFEALDKK
ncbi:TetR/AcrR family transcriptional regulator [Persicitalea jodogahamensis]|uniref:TetR family transcriptional regulator n=1 Tax=Persicitalea jodogahamensis TaxID=402147 RepID=A0A8J3G7X1_9BACT|nr:TetR/AcrR family transcriptional regulator [Persicitalea jodogahamensis]GHB52742.1 TetR family transcriptional regulator [Persicitalea jodogahamensis]